MDHEMHAAIIPSGSTPQQRIERTVVSRLKETIDSKGLEAPGIMVIGTVATLHDVLGDLR